MIVLSSLVIAHEESARKLGLVERKYTCFYNAFFFLLRSYDVRQRKIRIPACLQPLEKKKGGGGWGEKGWKKIPKMQFEHMRSKSKVSKKALGSIQHRVEGLRSSELSLWLKLQIVSKSFLNKICLRRKYWCQWGGKLWFTENRKEKGSFNQESVINLLLRQSLGKTHSPGRTCLESSRLIWQSLSLINAWPQGLLNSLNSLRRENWEPISSGEHPVPQPSPAKGLDCSQPHRDDEMEAALTRRKVNRLHCC